MKTFQISEDIKNVSRVGLGCMRLTEKKTDQEVRAIVDTALENGINFTDNEEIAIVLTDEELEIFLDDEGICKRCRKLYMGHDVLLDAQQAQALQEYNIAVNVIPDYYYKELEG